MWEQFIDLMNGTVAAIGQAQQASLKAMTRNMELTANTYARMLGQPGEEVVKADRRFKDSAWRDNVYADVMKQSYLINYMWMQDVADSLENIDPELHGRSKYWTRQVADALSPTNFFLTNPTVMEETIRTGGANVMKGMQNMLSDMQTGRITQVPANAFEVGVDLATTPGQVVYRNPLIELIQYTPTTEKVRSTPILVTPPWINKYYVMDLRPDNSMFQYLVDAGFTVFAISWKNPDDSVLHLEWDDYMEMGLLEALKVVRSITGVRKVNMVGYCLGGIAQQYTLAYLAATGKDYAKTATYFTTHQDFTQAGEVNIFISENDIQFLDLLMTASGGYLDGRNMAATFNMLRANDLLWNYVINNYLMGKQPPAFDLLYWNSDGTRVPQKVHMYLIREFFLNNKLEQPNALEMRGVGIDTTQINVPTYAVATLRDHIVPWKGAFKIREMVGGPVRFVLAESGHIAGVISHPSSKKRSYWYCDEADTETDPDNWFDCASDNKQEGSWWLDWIPWLEKQSGKMADPPSMGNDKYQPIMDAPGTYVLEK